MTTPTDPTTLRTALEALVGLVDCYGLDHYGGDWGCAECHPDSDMLVAGFQCGLHLARAVLATPAPAADEARCAFVGCGGVRDDVFHEPCLPGGAFHDHKACHPFQPAPTPAPPTPPATEPVAALVEGNVYRLERVYHEDGSYSILPVPLAAARAEVDVEALALALHDAHIECRFWYVDGARTESEFHHDHATRIIAALARRAGEGTVTDLDPRWAFYQEALDHAVYLRQAIEERRLLTAALTMIVADIDLSYWDDTRRHMHRDEWLTWVRREVEAWFVRAALDAGQQR